MESKTIYCGGGKKQKEDWLKITIDPEKIKDHIQEFNGSKFVKLNINIRPEPNQFGKDVSVSIDTFVPEKKEGFNADENNHDNSLPF
jgi:hypothetical protein